MSEYYIIVNPVAGRGAGELTVPQLEVLARRLQWDYELVRTAAPRHATQLAQQAAAAGCRVVVAVGGDGTSNDVLNGLLQASQQGQGQAILGIIPVGRGNDFAAGVGLQPASRPDLQASLNRLVTGKPRRMDVGRVTGGLYPDGLYFGNGVGIGFDAIVGFEALKLNRSPFYRWFSFATYLVAALRTILLYGRAPLLRIETDTMQVEQRALMVSIMNGWRLGGLFKMAPQAKIDDGWLDLCLAGEVSRSGMLGLLVHFMRGTQSAHPAIKVARARHLHIRALQGVLPAHADGETLCTEGNELTIELLPQALEVLMPPGEER